MRRFMLVTILGCLCGVARAHESRPLYAQIKQKAGALAATLSVPNTVTANNIPSLSISGVAELNAAAPRLEISEGGYRQTQNFQATPEDLRGKTLSVNFPAFNPALTTIITIEFADGETETLILAPGEKSVAVKAGQSRWAIASGYARLGVKHIWEGYDHLLFVVCLVLVAGFTRKLLLAVTGFTLAHSVTLALSALDVARLPIPPIEASIALSILFLATEIARHDAARPSLAFRYPILVSTGFGLLHGFGFASVLNEIGLPDNGKTIALLFFNVGVEIGQVVFVLAVFVLGILLTKLLGNVAENRNYMPKLRLAGVYAIGILSAFWFLQRIFGAI
jgi:hydrogenase/urease accessory protein HupE